MVIFPQQNLLLNEFLQVKQQAATHSLMNVTAEAIQQLLPTSDFEAMQNELQRVHQFKMMIDNGDNFPDRDYTDISKDLALLKIDNSILSADQCLRIQQCLHVAQQIFSFFKNRKGIYEPLEEIIGNLLYDNSMQLWIEEVFDSEGVIKSSASDELYKIRKSLSRKRSEADKLFQTIVNRYRKAGYISDTEESMRNGRRVIAIVAEQKRNLGGVIHDTSATGKTAYLEPDELLPINNAILGLEQEERTEILRILKELTTKLRIKYFHIDAYFDIQKQCDLLRARAMYAAQLGAVLPLLKDEPSIDIKNAYHPVLMLQNKLQGKTTIPFSLYLRNKNRIMVISGPNAGGKTICMKAVALLQLMLQSGFLVPCAAHSEFGFFDKLLVDIGDSQSIEYELSTYSSRLQKMNMFLHEANERTLFIIDEFGTGTDPTLGGALAEAILEKLNELKSIGIITTHFINLKVLADKTEGIINGCMLFDPEKLEPKYKLVVGKPGSSYTFLVAERSGMDKEIIKNAESKVSKNHILLENMLRDVENQKQVIDKKTKNIAHAEEALDEMLEKYGKLSSQAEQSKQTIDSKIKQTELRLIKQFDDKVIKFVNEWKNSKDKKAVLAKYERMHGKEKSEIAKVQSKEQQRIQQEYISKLKPGVFVHLKGGKTIGMIDSMDDKKVLVIFNGFKTHCDINNLIPIEMEDVPMGVRKGFSS